MPHPLNLEWRNHNALRRFPFAGEASLVDDSVSFTIPSDFLLDLTLPVHASMELDHSRYYVREIGAFATGYALVVAHDDGSTIVDVATALIPRTTHVFGKRYALGGVEPFDDVVGHVVIGKLETIDQQPAGRYEFSLAATQLETWAIRPNLRAVQGLRVVNGSDVSPLIFGDVEFVAGANFQLVAALVDGQDPRIVLNAISGEGLTQECVCEGDEQQLPCVKTINGVSPTEDGRLELVGNECLEFQPFVGGLRILDKCCQPCCGCEELETLTSELERLKTQQETLGLFASQFNTVQEQFSLTVLGARLGDRNCIVCE